jgi:phosphoribosyl 1,2-cyclic phosphodiesterase
MPTKDEWFKTKIAFNMIFQSFYSSSASNLYVVTAANGKRLLIECGCRWKQLLKAIAYKLDNIAGCCITHSHLDHSRAIEDVLDNGIDVFASHGTLEALGVVHRRAFRLQDKDTCIVSDDFKVFPFAVSHDAAEPLGFIVKSDGESLLFVTDTNLVKPRFACAFNTIAICCNYDGELLKKRVENKDINETFAKRLLDSHMEWHTTKSYIRDCCNLDKCTEIHLLHMSGSNIDKEKIRAEFEKEFMIKTMIAGS